MLYRLEHRIHTLAKIDLDRNTFTIEGVTFSQWPTVDNSGGHQYWLSTAIIEADYYRPAWRDFRNKLIRIVPRIALVSQCYIEFLGQPMLIQRSGQNVAFIHWIGQDGPAGLSFWSHEVEALETLLRHDQLPEEFFYYWNDATNCDGYASKLLLMLSALETLVNIPTEKGRPQKDWEKLELILGADIKKALWGEENKTRDALRHRLIHGRYFDTEDDGVDYVEVVHRRVIRYLNNVAFKKNLLDDSVVNPQRHPSGSRSQEKAFIKATDGAPLKLANVLAEATENLDNMPSYETLPFDDYEPTY